jgi:hypothetical protein
MLKNRNDKLFILEGLEIGRLTVGDLVTDVRNHPLYPETAQSYLKQGRLREVHCKCGSVRLIAESILSTGRVQSCGCLRREMRAAAREEGIKNLRKKADKAQCTFDIQIAQAELRAELAKDVRTRDEKKVDEIAARIRRLFSKKAQLSRKESQRDTWKRHNLANRQANIDKLLQDPEADNSETS